MGQRKKQNGVPPQRVTIQLMKRIMIHMRGQMDELLRPQGVTTAQLQMLRAVHASPGSSGAQLARECYVTPQSAQELIRHLEEGGYIVRGKDQINGRIITATITPAGERLLKKAEETALELQERLWLGISGGEVKALNEVLERCLKNIGEDGAG